MPTYDYECPNPDCRRVEVVEHSISKTPAIMCESCGKRMKRLISAGTDFQLRGTGWAKDNYS